MAKKTSDKYNTTEHDKKKEFFTKKRTKQLKRLFRLGMVFLEGLWALIRFIHRIRSLWG